MATNPTPFIPVGDLHPASWHQDRATGIGGSESAAMYNEGYGCYRQLVMEKRGTPADYKRTAQEEKILRRGNKMEDLVAAEFADETGLKVRRQPSRVSKTHPYARVNMDRQIVNVDPQHLYELTKDEYGFSPIAEILLTLGPGALECKTMNEFDFRRLCKEGFSKHPHYIFQLQHTLGVTGYKWGFFAVLEPRSFELRWFIMLRDEKLIADILDRTDRTWDLVMDTTQPLPAPLPDKDRRCNKCLWRRTCRGDKYLADNMGADFATDYLTVTDPEIIELANELVVASEQEDLAGDVTKAIKEKIKARMKADKTRKLTVPDVLRFNLYDIAGRKGLDSKAIDGEINALNKGEISGVEDVTPEELAEHSGLISLILKHIADRLEKCKKVGNPSEGFKVITV